MKNMYDIKEELECRFNHIYKKTVNETKNNKNKKAFVLGGQPGAGKSKLTKLIEKENDVIIINGDEYRKYHPNFEELQNRFKEDSVLYTAEFSGKITEKLINKLSDEGYNLVIEGTLRTAKTPIKTCELLKNKGYEVNLCLIQVRPEFSLLGTFERYARMTELKTTTRFTPVEHHNNVVKNIPENLDIIYKKNIFDNIEIYNREGTNLYSQKNTPDINPMNIFENEFNRKLTKNEIKNLNEKYDDVINILEKEKVDRRVLNIVREEKIKLPKISRWISNDKDELER